MFSDAWFVDHVFLACRPNVNANKYQCQSRQQQYQHQQRNHAKLSAAAGSDRSQQR
jgi:hypothetical protein